VGKIITSNFSGFGRTKFQFFIVIIIKDLFLGAFAKLRKAAIRFVMSVHLSICVEHLGYHWTDFNE